MAKRERTRATGKKYTRAERDAIRRAYDEGWGDGQWHGTEKQNDGWNRLARKYGMKEVK